MTRIKICGITNWEDARLAVDLGADFLGFIFASSPRRVTPGAARAITRRLPRDVAAVAVVRNTGADAAMALREASGCGWVQLHGNETPAEAARFFPYVIKAFSQYRRGPATFAPFAGSVLLLDQPKRGGAESPAGGMPRRARRPSAVSEEFLRLARKARRFGRVILAGGLDPDNVGEWIDRLRPWGVDVARGVEARPGKKDPARLKAFFEAVRKGE
jgi:phosphoribosylanthranilate isomerase